MQWQAASVAMVISQNDAFIFYFIHCPSVRPLGAREGVTVSPHGACCKIDLPQCNKAFSCVSELFKDLNLSS